MMAGAYSLDLYCDGEGCDYNATGPSQYTAETGEECRAEARAHGWLLGKNKELCPRCSKKKRVKLKPEPKIGPGWTSISLTEIEEFHRWKKTQK